MSFTDGDYGAHTEQKVQFRTFEAADKNVDQRYVFSDTPPKDNVNT